MGLDAGPLAEHAAEVIDKVIADYGPDVELVDAVVVVELVADADDDENVRSTIAVYPMSGRNVPAVGMLVRGLVAAVAPDD